MTVAYMVEKVFLEEIRAANQVWVAKGTCNNIYSQELNRGEISLPVWSSSERVSSFLKHALLVGTKYEPHAISLEVFTNAWLSDKMKGITELQLNQDGKSDRVLAYTTEEFISALSA
uniref:DUF2750 domain-containing protein n=1 Tax=Geobacter metallireducens TaxID=28232 RepID=A0A831U2W6_GEOME